MAFGMKPEQPLCFEHKDYVGTSWVLGDGNCEKHGSFAFQDDAPKILCIQCAKEENRCRVCGNNLTQKEIDYQNTKHLFEQWEQSTHWIDRLKGFFQNPRTFPLPKEDVDEFKMNLKLFYKNIMYLEKKSLELIEGKE